MGSEKKNLFTTKIRNIKENLLKLEGKNDGSGSKLNCSDFKKGTKARTLQISTTVCHCLSLKIGSVLALDGSRKLFLWFFSRLQG